MIEKQRKKIINVNQSVNDKRKNEINAQKKLNKTEKNRMSADNGFKKILALGERNKIND